MTSGSAAAGSLWRYASAFALLLLLGCGDDPIAADPTCAEAPAIELGQSLDGRLSSRDPTFQGARVDYYSLRLVDSTRVTFRLTSPDFDPFLYLFGSDAQIVAQAFDSVGAPAGQVESASLQQRLAPGCHLVGASSWERNTTGAYSLGVDSLTSSVPSAPAFSGSSSRTERSSDRN